MIDVRVLVKAAKRVKDSKGTMDKLVMEFTDAEVGSEEFKRVKQNITQALTNTRKTLRERLMATGLTEDEASEKVAKVVPSFREGRMTNRHAVMDELFAELEKLSSDEDEELVDEESGLVSA